MNGLSTHFVWTNRGKESLCLDIKTSKGQTIVHSLLEKADICIQNLLPGATSKLGLSSAQLRSKYPQLISCTISGYGPKGPYQHKKAYDLLVQSESGLLSVTGTEQEPVKVCYLF